MNIFWLAFCKGEVFVVGSLNVLICIVAVLCLVCRYQVFLYTCCFNDPHVQNVGLNSVICSCSLSHFVFICCVRSCFKSFLRWNFLHHLFTIVAEQFLEDEHTYSEVILVSISRFYTSLHTSSMSESHMRIWLTFFFHRFSFTCLKIQ